MTYRALAATTTLIAALALTGCGSDADTAPAPAPSQSASTPVQVPAPTMLDLATATELTMALGENPVVLTDPVADPTQWTATFSEDGIVEFAPGRTDGTATFNASLTAVAAGTTTVTLANPTAPKPVTLTVTVTPAGTTTSPSPAATSNPSPGATTNPEEQMKEMEAVRQRAEQLAGDLVGMSEQAAIAKIAAAADGPFEHRIVERDGEGFPATMDYRPNRLNLTITKGTVSKVDVG